MIFVLDNKDVVVGVLSNSAPSACGYFDDNHTENIETGVHYYDFSVPAAHETAGVIASEGSVIIKDLDGKLQQFKIKNIVETNNSSGYFKAVSTEHVAISELLTDIVRPASLKSTTLAAAMNYVLDGTEYSLGDVDFIGSFDIDFAEHITVLEAIYQIIAQFEAEIQFEVVFEHGIIQKKLVHVQEKRGNVTEKVFSYSKDLVEVERNEDSEGLITALIPVGTGSNGKPLTLVGFEYSKDGLITKQADDFIFSEESLQEYGKNGKHLFGVFKDSEAKTQVELFNNGVKELNVRRKPKFTFKCGVTTLERILGYSAEKVRVGDTVLIKDFTFEPALLLEARILELTRSYTNPENDAVVLGDYRPLAISSPSSLEALQALIAQREAIWNANAYRVTIQTSNGTVFKNGIGSTKLFGTLFYADNETDFDGTEYTYKWTIRDKNGVVIEYLSSKSVELIAANIDEVISCVVEISDGYKTLGTAEVSVTNVLDGEKGEKGDSGYTPVKGTDYFDGKDGQNGKDGSSAFMHVRYATSASGAGMTTSPTGATYIGIATTATSTAPTTAASYQWSLIKGTDGIQGEKGSDGKTSYLHIKYSNDGGATFTANSGETVGSYIGMYVDFVQADSTNVSAYTWNKVRGDDGLQGLQGEKGEQGIAGKAGADGRTSYTHIAYADSSDGTLNFSVSDSNRAYVGMYVDFVSTDSTSPASYKWTLVKGADGSQGIQGAAGVDGKTPYLHIAYATDSTGTAGFSTTVSTGKTYIGQYTDFTSADSTDATKYKWTLIKGDKGDTGNTGAKGDKGDKGEGAGRNLYRGSLLQSASSSNAAASILTENDIKYARFESTGSGTYFGLQTASAERVSVYPQKTVTLSFEARGNVIDFNYTYVMRMDGTNTSVPTGTVSLSTTEWTKITRTVTLAWSTIQGYILIASRDVAAGKWFEVRKIQVEEGLTASEWFPNPVDLDVKIQEAKAATDTAQATADGKNSVFYQTDAPSTLNRKIGDLWFDTDNGYLMYRWTGSAWTSYQLGNNALQEIDAAKINTGYINSGRISVDTLTGKTLTGGTVNGGNINLLNAGNFKATDSLVATSFLIKNGLFSGSIGTGTAFYGWMDGDFDTYKGFNGNAAGGYISAVVGNGTLDAGITTSGLASLEVNNLRLSGNVEGILRLPDGQISLGTTGRFVDTAGITYLQSGGATTTPGEIRLAQWMSTTGELKRVGIYAAATYVSSGFEIGSGYFSLNAFSSTYGSGKGRFYYNANETRFQTASSEGWYIGGALSAASVTNRSMTKFKKNIEDYDVTLSGKSAIEEIMGTKPKMYHYNEDNDAELKRLGLIFEEAPADILEWSSDGVNVYAMATMLWKATQEQQVLIEDLQKRVAELEVA